MKGILFDFDYTLGDSTPGILSSIQYALTRMSLPLPPEDALCRTIGLSLPDTYKVLTGDFSPAHAQTFSRLFKEKADQVMVSSTSFLPGAIQTLEQLQAIGIKTGIVTTKYHRRIEQIFSAYKLEGLVDAIVGGEDVAMPKPDPEGLLKILFLLQLKKAEVLYVGDSVTDALAAAAAGISFAGVTTGTTPASLLATHPHTAIFSSIKEVLPFLQNRFPDDFPFTG